MDGDNHNGFREALEQAFHDLERLKTLIATLQAENRLLRERAAGLRPIEEFGDSDMECIPALLRRQAG